MTPLISRLPAFARAARPPLFRSAVGRTGTLTAKAMNRIDAWRMIQRRAAEASVRAPGSAAIPSAPRASPPIWKPAAR